GSHACAATREPGKPLRQSRKGVRPGRPPDREPGPRLCHARKIDARMVDGSDLRSEGTPRGPEKSGRGGEERAARVARYCRAAALRGEAFMSVIRILALAAVAAGSLSVTAAFAADAAKGKQKYVTNGCFQCHGTVGQGGAGP